MKTHSETMPRRDPRIYQVAVLSLLLGYGKIWLAFEISVPAIAIILASVLLAL